MDKQINIEELQETIDSHIRLNPELVNIIEDSEPWYDLSDIDNEEDLDDLISQFLHNLNCAADALIELAESVEKWRDSWK